ncbi:hypothetical protein K439DRAFT_1627420 [Ramaria rubella]|nr:hypothetical protein K439DRAFT_1627420 [Ramaria rubella]
MTNTPRFINPSISVDVRSGDQRVGNVEESEANDTLFFFTDLPSDCATPKKKMDRFSAHDASSGYCLSPPPPLRDSIKFSGLRAKYQLRMTFNDDVEYSPSNTYIKDDDEIMEWQRTVVDNSSSPRAEAMILSTPPSSPPEKQLIEGRPIKGSSKAIFVAPKSPASRYGASKGFEEIENSASDGLGSS